MQAMAKKAVRAPAARSPADSCGNPVTRAPAMPTDSDEPSVSLICRAGGVGPLLAGVGLVEDQQGDQGDEGDGRKPVTARQQPRSFRRVRDRLQSAGHQAATRSATR